MSVTLISQKPPGETQTLDALAANINVPQKRPLSTSGSDHYSHMVDLRITLVAIGVWVCSVAVLNSWICVPVAFVFAGIALIVVVTTAVFWFCGTYVGRIRVHPRHARYPMGSLRLAIALVFLGITASLICSAHAMRIYQRDPASILAKQGMSSMEMVVDLHDDPTPVGSRWAKNQHSVRVGVVFVKDGHGRWLESSGVNIWLTGEGLSRFSRYDRVHVGGVLDQKFMNTPPSVGSLKVRSSALLDRPGGWKAMARELRTMFRQVCSDLDQQGRALVPGMTIGDTIQMEKKLSDAMKTSSLTHLTAVSGAHVSIMLGALLVMMPDNRWLRVGATVLLLLVLVAVVGPDPAVMRAVSTTSVGVLGLIARRSGQGQAGLSLVVLLTILLDPWVALSFGFALSVAASWAILGPARVWTGRFKKHMNRPGFFAGMMGRIVELGIVSFVIQLWVTPILLLFSPGIPIWGVAANVFVAPAIAPACLFGLFSVCVCSWLPVLASWSAHVSSWCTWWISCVGTGVSQLPLARFPWFEGAYGAGCILLVYAVVWAGVFVARKCRLRVRHLHWYVRKVGFRQEETSISGTSKESDPSISSGDPPCASGCSQGF